MCGDQSPEEVDQTILAISCQNAMRNCLSAECIKYHAKEVFNKRLAENSVTPVVCSKDINFIVTPNFWAARAYGLKYYKGSIANGEQYYCIAYCRS